MHLASWRCGPRSSSRSALLGCWFLLTAGHRKGNHRFHQLGCHILLGRLPFQAADCCLSTRLHEPCRGLSHLLKTMAWLYSLRLCAEALLQQWTVNLQNQSSIRPGCRGGDKIVKRSCQLDDWTVKQVLLLGFHLLQKPGLVSGACRTLHEMLSTSVLWTAAG